MAVSKGTHRLNVARGSLAAIMLATAGFAADPVPQAMVITGIVVAFAASALAIALVLRLFQETGRVTLRPDAFAKPPADGTGT